MLGASRRRHRARVETEGVAVLPDCVPMSLRAASAQEGLHYNRGSIPGCLCALSAAGRGSAKPFSLPVFLPLKTPMLGLNSRLVRLLLIAAMGVAFAARADELSEVQRMYYAGQADAAMQRADKFLVAHPKDAQMRFLKGVMLSDAKHTDEATALFQKLSEDYPDLAEPYNNLAVLYAGTGDYAKARATLEQALRTNPAYATAHENLGDVQAALAAQSYARALKLDPSNVTVPPKLAIVRQLIKHPASATGSAPAVDAKPGDAK